MQFFPAVDSRQAFAADSRFDFMGARTGQDFSGLLSQHLDQGGRPDPSSWPATGPFTESDTAAAQGQVSETSGSESPEPVPYTGQEPASSQCRPQDSPAHEPAGRGAQQEHAPEAAGHDEHPSDIAGAGTGRAETPAKDAEGAAVSTGAEGRDEGESHHCAHEGAVSAPAHDTADEHAAQDQEAAAMQAALDGVERTVRGLESVNPGAEERLAALRELLATFRQADPAQRKEMAVSLGAQITALHEAFASPGAAGVAGSVTSAKSGAARSGETESSAAGRSATPAAARSAKGGTDGVQTDTAEGRRKAGSGPQSAERSMVTGDGALLTDAALSRKQSGVRGAQAEAALPSETQGAVGKASPQESAAVSGEQAARPVGKTARSGEAASGRRGAAVRANGGEKTPVPPGGEQVRQEKAETGDGAEAALSVSPKAAEAPSTDAAVQVRRDAGPSTAVKSHAASQAVESVGRSEVAKDRGGLQQPHAVEPGDARQVPAQGAAEAKSEQGRQDARQGFFAAPSSERGGTVRSASSASGKNVTEVGTQVQGAGQNPQPMSQQRVESPLTPRSAEVYRQVETGAFRNLGQGGKQLVIRLDPEELGQVSVILQVKGKDVQAVLRASSQEASQALGEQLGQLRNQLESQGLKVGRLEVQTQLADSQEQSQWQGAEQHNRYQENRELALSAQRWRSFDQMDAGLVRDVQNGLQREKLSSSGLDIFA